MRPVFLGAAVAFLLAGESAAHMEMKTPPPRRSKFNPHEDYTTIDYTNTAPLAADGSNFPCKNYPSKGNVATLTAGGTLQVELTGGAPHGGGHCQFALSYDGGKSFGVLKTIIRNCMSGGEGLTPSVPIPADIPACTTCIFAWTWINAIGNREFYMNCADVEIQSSASGAISLPALTIANLPGYPTVPEFPNAGDPDGEDIFKNDRTVTIGSPSPSGSSAVTPDTANAVQSSPDAEPPQPAAQIPKTKTKKKKVVKRGKGKKAKTPSAAPPAASPATAPPPDVPATTPQPANRDTGSPSAAGSEACTPGTSRCSGTGFQPCVQGRSSWTFGPTQACAPGTHCVASGNQIQCVT